MFWCMYSQVAKLTSDLEEQIKNNTTLMTENSQKQMEIKQKDEEIELQKLEIIKVNKVHLEHYFLTCLSAPIHSGPAE